MHTVLLVNPVAGGGRVGRRWARLRPHIEQTYAPAQTKLTTSAARAREAVHTALAEGAERIAVVGGDGTLHTVANALFDDAGRPLVPDVVLAPIPAGTGSDFVRSLGRTGPPGFAKPGSVRRVDVGRVSYQARPGQPAQRLFLNIASAGATGRVVEQVTHATKVLGGRAAFFVGALRGLATHRRQRVCLRLDDQPVSERQLHTIVIANGRFFGGGMQIAPAARLDDGHFEVVVLDEVPLLQFLRLSRRLYHGDLPDLPWLHRFEAQQVSIEHTGSGPPWPVEADGEPLGTVPVRFDLLPQALRIQV